MKVDTYRCDVCGQIKGENNHWFRIDTAATTLELHSWGAVEPKESTVDLCSDQCVTKVVQKWLTAQAVASTASFSLAAEAKMRAVPANQRVF